MVTKDIHGDLQQVQGYKDPMKVTGSPTEFCNLYHMYVMYECTVRANKELTIDVKLVEPRTSKHSFQTA